MIDIFQQVLQVVEHTECSHQVALLREESERKIEQAKVLYDLANRLMEEAGDDLDRASILLKSLPSAIDMLDYEVAGMQKNCK
jgi:uracil phosphoribosyltransferase